MTRRWFHVGLFLIVFASLAVAQDRQTPLPNLLTALQQTRPDLSQPDLPSLYDAALSTASIQHLAPALKLYGSKGVAVQAVADRRQRGRK